MTWTETHERTRIIRAVEAAAELDMSGALPWREEWNAYFAGPDGLVTALRARWQRTCEAQLDDSEGHDELQETYTRLRRSNAGVLAILKRAEGGTIPTNAHVVLAVPSTTVSRRRRARRAHRALRGPALPV